MLVCGWDSGGGGFLSVLAASKWRDEYHIHTKPICLARIQLLFSVIRCSLRVVVLFPHCSGNEKHNPQTPVYDPPPAVPSLRLKPPSPKKQFRIFFPFFCFILFGYCVCVGFKTGIAGRVGVWGVEPGLGVEKSNKNTKNCVHGMLWL